MDSLWLHLIYQFEHLFKWKMRFFVLKFFSIKSRTYRKSWDKLIQLYFTLNYFWMSSKLIDFKQIRKKTCIFKTLETSKRLGCQIGQKCQTGPKKTVFFQSFAYRQFSTKMMNTSIKYEWGEHERRGWWSLVQCEQSKTEESIWRFSSCRR